MAALEDHLWSSVSSSVVDPALKTDLKSLQWIHRRFAFSEGHLRILLNLPTLLHPSLSELKESVQEAAEKELKLFFADRNWEMDVPEVDVQALATRPVPYMARHVEQMDELVKNLGPGLTRVSHFLGVYSCKGGVGKSTVAVNLAYELARMGGRVGLLDVDIYGPSLPVLVRPDDIAVRPSPRGKGMVYPIEHRGVKLLSLGFVSPESGVPGSGVGGGAAVMRGPMAGKAVAQLIKGTDWGELDVLVLDLPPGTGDVQLAVCQELSLSGAVAVTTPSKLAVADAKKGIEMFTTLGVPTLALVENMAYFECEGGGRHYPFGKGLEDISKVEKGLFGIPSSNIVQLPVSKFTNDSNDSGWPLCLTRPKWGAADELAAFEALAKAVSKELLSLQYDVADGQEFVVFGTPEQEFDLSTIHLSRDRKAEGKLIVRLFAETGAFQIGITGAELRHRDPKTGELIKAVPIPADEDNVSADSSEEVVVQRQKPRNTQIIPNRVEKKGRYGFAVQWADGATIIYSHLCIARAAGGDLKG